jgi:hypothetical protein
MSRKTNRATQQRAERRAARRKKRKGTEVQDSSYRPRTAPNLRRAFQGIHPLTDEQRYRNYGLWQRIKG